MEFVVRSVRLARDFRFLFFSLPLSFYPLYFYNEGRAILFQHIAT